MKFEQLIEGIENLQKELLNRTAVQVNTNLTIRNWMIGLYIIRYEQGGEDRAKYGDKLFEELADRLKKSKLKGLSATNLRLCRQFCKVYPQMREIISPIVQGGSIELPEVIHQSVTDELREGIIQKNISNTLSMELMLKHLSFTHFAELVKIDNLLKRTFYEIEGIKGKWSVRQLKRQIETLLFERTGLSIEKVQLLENVHLQNDNISISGILRDPYILEFTGLQEKPQYNENDLESALMEHLQTFLLELGHGFCFEGRQKRFTIDNEHYYVDMVFYHKYLRCQVLIDLKVGKFSHQDAGQMNFYLSYFAENETAVGDNPPIGIILCTDKNETVVKYATTKIDHDLFISKYLVELPEEEELRALIENDRTLLLNEPK
jgi:predicted nuclease of restriction endonuclease-like (RecB) superfamily